MKKIIKLLLLNILLLLTAISYAKEAIDLTDGNVAKDLLLNKTWTCHMVDGHGKTDGHWTFSSVEGNKVKGKIVIDQYMACSSDLMKGKIKNNTLKYFGRVNHSSCNAFNGNMSFYKNDSGEIIADGIYTYGGLRFRGTYTCELNS